MTVMPKKLQIMKLKELARSYGVAEDLIDWEAEVDKRLTYTENLHRLLPLIRSLAKEPAQATEYDKLEKDIERLTKEKQKLREKLEKAVLPERRKYEEYKKRIGEEKKEVSEMEERLEEFRKDVEQATLPELFTFFETEKPPEITTEEWDRRREIIHRELVKRKVPKSPVTHEFMRPVTMWQGIPVPEEMKFWYDPTEKRFYRDTKPIKPEDISKALRTLIKPIKPKEKKMKITPVYEETVITKVPTKDISILYKVDWVTMPASVRLKPVVVMFYSFMKLWAVRLFSVYNLKELLPEQMENVIDSAIAEFVKKAPNDLDELIDALEPYTDFKV